MTNATLVRTLLIFGAAGIGIAATTKGASLKRLGDELEIDTDTHAQFRNKELIVTAKVRIKNPTGESLQLFHPFVRVQFKENGDTFTSSDPKPKQYTLMPNDVLEIDPIILRIGIIDLVRAIPKLVKQMKETRGLKVFVKYNVNVTGRSIPITMMDSYSVDFDSFDSLLNAIAS